MTTNILRALQKAEREFRPHDLQPVHRRHGRQALGLISHAHARHHRQPEGKAGLPHQPDSVVHGGGWRRGSKSQFVYPGDLVGAILAAGISVVSIDYRLTPQHTMPAQMEDVVRAVQFVRSKAWEWNLDPERIAVKGRSSGGHVALMVGFGPDRAQPDSDDPVLRQSSRPTCIVAGSAPTDFPRHMRELLQGDDRQEYLRGRLRALLGLGDEELPLDQLTSRLEPLSPFHIVTRDAPPVLLPHPGPADAYWPGDPRLKWDVHTPITGFILAERLKELRVPHKLVMMPEDSSGRGSGQVPAEELAFLERYLERL